MEITTIIEIICLFFIFLIFLFLGIAAEDHDPFNDGVHDY